MKLVVNKVYARVRFPLLRHFLQCAIKHQVFQSTRKWSHHTDRNEMSRFAPRTSQHVLVVMEHFLVTSRFHGGNDPSAFQLVGFGAKAE
jgi:hypothetical protein